MSAECQMNRFDERVEESVLVQPMLRWLACTGGTRDGLLSRLGSR